MPIQETPNIEASVGPMLEEGITGTSDVPVMCLKHDGGNDDRQESVNSLARNGISLKLKKCSFFRPKVHCLGHVISPGKLSVADTAADAFKTFTFPRTLTQVRSFLGACNVYRRFVKGFAKIERPLIEMTRKDSDPDFYNPTEAQLQAFEHLKKCMIAPPILALLRHGRI